MGIIRLIDQISKIARKNKKRNTNKYPKNLNNNTNYIYQNEEYDNKYNKIELLTNNERKFYEKLKAITKKYNYEILAKIRLADLIEVNEELSNSEWAKYFGKIKSKHIDFAIHENMNIICLIELDDYTHQRRDRKERDEFVDTVLRQNGYAVIHTYGDSRSLKDIEDFFNY